MSLDYPPPIHRADGSGGFCDPRPHRLHYPPLPPPPPPQSHPQNFFPYHVPPPLPRPPNSQPSPSSVGSLHPQPARIPLRQRFSPAPPPPSHPRYFPQARTPPFGPSPHVHSSPAPVPTPLPRTEPIHYVSHLRRPHAKIRILDREGTFRPQVDFPSYGPVVIERPGSSFYIDFTLDIAFNLRKAFRPEITLLYAGKVTPQGEFKFSRSDVLMDRPETFPSPWKSLICTESLQFHPSGGGSRTQVRWTLRLRPELFGIDCGGDGQGQGVKPVLRARQKEKRIYLVRSTLGCKVFTGTSERSGTEFSFESYFPLRMSRPSRMRYVHELEEDSLELRTRNTIFPAPPPPRPPLPPEYFLRFSSTSSSSSNSNRYPPPPLPSFPRIAEAMRASPAVGGALPVPRAVVPPPPQAIPKGVRVNPIPIPIPTVTPPGISVSNGVVDYSSMIQDGDFERFIGGGGAGGGDVGCWDREDVTSLSILPNWEEEEEEEEEEGIDLEMFPMPMPMTLADPFDLIRVGRAEFDSELELESKESEDSVSVSCFSTPRMRVEREEEGEEGEVVAVVVESSESDEENDCNDCISGLQTPREEEEVQKSPQKRFLSLGLLKDVSRTVLPLPPRKSLPSLVTSPTSTTSPLEQMSLSRVERLCESSNAHLERLVKNDEEKIGLLRTISEGLFKVLGMSSSSLRSSSNVISRDERESMSEARALAEFNSVRTEMNHRQREEEALRDSILAKEKISELERQELCDVRVKQEMSMLLKDAFERGMIVSNSNSKKTSSSLPPPLRRKVPLRGSRAISNLPPPLRRKAAFVRRPRRPFRKARDLDTEGTDESCFYRSSRVRGGRRRRRRLRKPVPFDEALDHLSSGSPSPSVSSSSSSSSDEDEDDSPNESPPAFSSSPRVVAVASESTEEDNCESVSSSPSPIVPAPEYELCFSDDDVGDEGVLLAPPPPRPRFTNGAVPLLQAPPKRHTSKRDPRRSYRFVPTINAAHRSNVFIQEDTIRFEKGLHSRFRQEAQRMVHRHFMNRRHLSTAGRRAKAAPKTKTFICPSMVQDVGILRRALQRRIELEVEDGGEFYDETVPTLIALSGKVSSTRFPSDRALQLMFEYDASSPSSLPLDEDDLFFQKLMRRLFPKNQKNVGRLFREMLLWIKQSKVLLWDVGNLIPPLYAVSTSYYELLHSDSFKRLLSYIKMFYRWVGYGVRSRTALELKKCFDDLSRSKSSGKTDLRLIIETFCAHQHSDSSDFLPFEQVIEEILPLLSKLDGTQIPRRVTAEIREYAGVLNKLVQQFDLWRKMFSSSLPAFQDFLQYSKRRLDSLVNLVPQLETVKMNLDKVLVRMDRRLGVSREEIYGGGFIDAALSFFMVMKRAVGVVKKEVLGVVSSTSSPISLLQFESSTSSSTSDYADYRFVGRCGDNGNGRQ